MKKKISRILGVVLTLALLSSLAIVVAPVSAGTQSWSTFGTPGTSGLVLDTGNTWTGPWDIDINGSAIYAASNVGGAGFGAVSLVKSTDGGRTWTNLTGLVPAYAGWSPTITDIVCSSIDANTVYVTDGYDIYKTSDGGTNWVPLSNLFTSGAGWASPPTGLITSIDVGYLGTNPYIFAATSTFGAAGGGAYVAEEAVWGMPWSDLLLDTDRPVPVGNPWGWGTDVNVIMVDPVNFATTQMVMAVATDYNTFATVVTTKYGGAQWDTTVNDVVLPGVNGILLTASLWLPDNFSSSLLSGNMQAFVSAANTTWWGPPAGDVFLAVFAAPTVANTAAFDLNLRGAGTVTQVTGLDGVGSIGTAQLLASGYSSAAPTTPRTWRSLNGGFTWLADTKAPTGGASPLWGTALSSVLVLDSSTALVATHGPDAGVSITNDFGRVWNGISLLNATITSIDDLGLGSLFMTTSGANDAVWRHDGTNWERVFSGSIFANATTNFVVEASPTGDAVFVADVGGTTIWRSTDDGQTWTAQTNAVPGAISGLVVIDANNQVVGGPPNTVYTTATNGGFWFTRTCTVGTIQALAYDQGTGDLLVGGTTDIRRSTNGGTSWSAIGTPLTAAITATSLAFSDDYGNNSTVYATGTDANAVAGVWAYDFSAGAPAWSQIDGDGVAPPAIGAGTVANGTGLVSAPGISGVDMVYAADGVTGAGVARIKGNRTTAEVIADAGNAFMGLWYEPGSNILYTIDTNGPRIRTYTDTLAVSGTGVTVSAVTATGATLSWDALANATGYRAVVHTSALDNFYTAPGIPPTWIANTTGNSATVTGLTNNTRYYVSVWARTPVSSFKFSGASMVITPETVATPTNQVPMNGMQNASTLPSFVWGAVSGAEHYEFELSTDPSFTDPGALIVSTTISAPVTAYTSTIPLAYDTNHYWRVRAVSTNSLSGVDAYSGWCFSNFHTMVEPQPPVVIPPQPTPTITIEIPDIEWPEIPDLSDLIPDITIPPPDITLPDITLPPVEIPDITLPEVVLPDITLPPVEIPDITLPAPQVTVVPPVVTQTTVPAPVIEITETAPVYIWAIVGIGAVLVIAVIVLIVRTRRIV